MSSDRDLSLDEIVKRAEYFAVTFEKQLTRPEIVSELTRFGCRLVGLPDPDQSGEPPEPIEFGSVIYARVSLYDGLTLWQRTSGGAWTSDDGAFVGSYKFLRDITLVQRGVTKS